MTAVLDASAVLALIYREPGHDQVAQALPGAVLCTVNYSEVIQKLAHRGHPAPVDAAGVVVSLGVEVIPFIADDAVTAARLWPATRAAGLSLGDRACLAVTARIPDGRALTADHPWTTLDVGVPVDLIR